MPAPARQPGATIVTVGSVNAFLPDPGVIDYSAAKAALTNMSKSLSKEFGGRIRVNTISPGPVATDLWLGTEGVAATVAQAHGLSPAAVAEQAASQSVTGRFTQPERNRGSRAVPGQRTGGQHHRQRLHDRRRPGHNPLAERVHFVIAIGVATS